MVEEVTTVGEYLDDLQWATEDNGTVVFDGVSGGALLEERAALFKNIKDDMKHVFKDARMILSMAPEGQGLGFHLHAATWLKLWHGHKEWLVYPPGKMPAALHSSANVHGRFEHERIESLPKEQQPLRCIQQPGDIVYLPGAPRLFINCVLIVKLVLAGAFAHATRNLPGTGVAIAVGVQAQGNRVMTELTDVVALALETNPSDLEALLFLAGAAFTENRPEDAMALCNRAKDVMPQDIRASFMLASAYGQKRDRNGFISAITDGLDTLEKTNADQQLPSNLMGSLVARLSWMLVKSGAPKEALERLEPYRSKTDSTYNLVKLAIAVVSVQTGSFSAGLHGLERIDFGRLGQQHQKHAKWAATQLANRDYKKTVVDALQKKWEDGDAPKRGHSPGKNTAAHNEL
jgi:hypothetical protein